MTVEELSKFDLPENPGVYFFKRGAEILYIGKATSLRDRVRSYFSNDLIATRGARIVDMVFKADSIEWEERDSVLEAMIAEANLIKKHWPHYNVQEKDDKSFNYVIITDEDFPRILTIRGRTLDVELAKKELSVKKQFGPFPNGSALREALKIIRKMFPYVDKGSLGKGKYQFYRQLGLTPDVSSVDARHDYAKTVRHITLFFEGKKGELVRELEREMSAHAKAQEFEKANLVKRKLFALDHIQDIALIKEDLLSSAERGEANAGEVAARGGFRIEAYDVAHMSGKESVGVMTVIIDGEKAPAEYRKFKLSADIGNNDVASLREILSRRLAHADWRMPDLIVVDGGLGQKNLAEGMIAGRVPSAPAIPVLSVVKDDRHRAREILGDAALADRHKKSILLANAEAHRFAIAYHRKLRRIKNTVRGKL
jgi:excinuclease ABC subunit C